MDFVLPNLNIENIKSKLSELEKELNTTANDYSKIGELNAQYKHYEEILSTWERAQSLLEKYRQAYGLQNSELATLAKQELSNLEEELPQLIAKLENYTQAELKNDQSNAILEIRAGTGGTEAALFAEEISRMYLRYLNSIGFTVERLSISYEGEGGIKEAIFRVVGDYAFGRLRFEGGVHRVQRVPVTEAGGRIHTSTISLVVLPEAEASDIDIDEQDLRIDVYHSSGPGGQSVNTTDSAVRILHKPTGIIVTCQDSKSQHKNKAKALSILYSRLYALAEEKQAAETKDLRLQAIQGGDRSAKIRTYNFPQGRITDHRIKQSWFNINEAMEGNIHEIVTTVNSQLRKLLSKESVNS